MEKMEAIVKECLSKYVGGNKYFHEMDERIKYDPEILQAMLDGVYGANFLVLSGQFGRQMVDYIRAKNLQWNYILLVGSPRKYESTKILDMRMYNHDLHGIFLDDTYFSGRTFFYCKGYVEAKFGISVYRALVAYDGSRHRDSSVSSLYRYYDYHDKDGNEL